MFKTILVTLVVSVLMSVAAIAGEAEIVAAYKALDFVLCISEANKVISNPTSTANERGRAKLYKVFCSVPNSTITEEEFSALSAANQVDYARRLLPKTERGGWTQKAAASIKPELLSEDHKGSVFYYINDFILADLGGQDFLLKILQRNNVFRDECLIDKLSLCTKDTLKQANLHERAATLLTSIGRDTTALDIKTAFSFVDKLALGKEAYLKILDDAIFIIPATAENAEFLGLLKSEQEK